MIKESEKYTDGKTLYGTWTRELNIVKMSLTLHATPIQMPMAFLIQHEQVILNCYETIKIRKSQNNMKQKKWQSWSLALSILTTDYKILVITFHAVVYTQTYGPTTHEAQ